MIDENDLLLPIIQDGEDKSSILKNRIRKNYRHVRKWAKRTSTNCFRIYDRDIKEYPLAIDFYAGNFCVQFFSYDRDEEDPRAAMKAEALEAICTIFGVTEDVIFWRNRIKRAKTEQYEKLGEEKEYIVVYEYGVKFLINLNDYLDTGLFLDHRETRQMVAHQAKGKRVLNLFAYTCSFSVHAAIAGAKSTTSIDLSNTYTQWGRENFVLNDLSLEKNDVIRADCMRFLDDEVFSTTKYDLIIIDPPTISRSKKMDQMFDIQLDYIPILSQALKILARDGTLYFSTNFRKFKFDESYFDDCFIEEVTSKTIPLDFHNQKIHRCWKIRLR